ncbi:MAG: arsenate reductase ArsC [Actinobacteria bacterium]|jgi:arsenate reductase|nr:MAG: arsenate reductase ArsC [Actinomycetota bacterium]
MDKILFVCGENAARSQIAEAFFNRLADAWIAESAGTHPAAAVNPLAVEAMAEVGIDISLAVPKPLYLSSLQGFRRIISFGCIVKSVFPARDRLEEWLIDDPGRRDMATMRETRDRIASMVAELVRELEG